MARLLSCWRWTLALHSITCTPAGCGVDHFFALLFVFRDGASVGVSVSVSVCGWERQNADDVGLDVLSCLGVGLTYLGQRQNALPNEN